MSLKLKTKKGVAVLLLCTLLTTSTVVSYAKMFGREYDSSRDYSCCVGNQMYIFHAYTSHFFWFVTGTGFEPVPVGNPTADGQCTFQCPPENTITTGM